MYTTFTAKTHHATPTGANHPHPLRIPLVMCKFHAKIFFLQTYILGNSFPRGISPDLCKLNLFKSRVIRYIPIYIYINNASYSVTVYIEWLLVFSAFVPAVVFTLTPSPASTCIYVFTESAFLKKHGRINTSKTL